jgi:hypothetical protein
MAKSSTTKTTAPKVTKAKPDAKAKTKIASATDATPVETPKTEKKAKPAKADTPKKMSALDAAAKVLGDAGEPMNTKTMIETMAKKGLWTSPGGKTPGATLYAAILREITVKGGESRFKKTAKGHFATK